MLFSSDIHLPLAAIFYELSDKISCKDHRSIFSSLPFQCSFHKCDRQVKNNFDGASEFYNDYGREVGQGFMCYFEPNSHDYAIVKVITKATVIHAMLWPSVAVIVAIIILGLSLSEKGQATRNSSQRNAHSSPTFDLRYPGHRVGVEYEIIESWQSKWQTNKPQSCKNDLKITYCVNLLDYKKIPWCWT